MFLHLPKKLTLSVAAIVVAAMSFFIVSCQKELSGGGFTVNETQPDLATKISSSVSGFVTNESDAVVEGATVQAGGVTTTTDKYGYFSIRNVQVVKNAAVVTVTKAGYFNGIKTFIADAGHAGFFRIKLLPKTTSGSFDAAAGGMVTLTNGLSITFPANAIRLASGGSYSGQVNVAAQWLNPSAEDIIRTMPGDLRGLDTDGFMRVLTSYGMSATELTGAGGELLQIADGKKAAVSFPIPPGANASAPATIPLWHFNETNGLWIEEGSATKTGSAYVGEVSHFSWWNCDLPNATVPLTFDVVDGSGNPVGGVYVNIVATSNNSWSHAGGYTDSTGHVSILVTANTQYTLSVYGDCGSWNNPTYTQDFSVGTTAVNLGDLTLTGPSIATVSGTVECNGSPLSNAYVVMKQGLFTHRYPVNTDGTYSFTHTLCSGNATVTFVAENLSTLQGGDPITYTLVAGNNTIPVLGACVNSIEQFINYTVNSSNYAIAYPSDSIIHYVNTQSTPPISYVYGGSNTGTSPQGSTASFSFDQAGIGTGTSQPLLSFFSSQINDSTNVTGTPVVHITEYGNVGEFISGNFDCTISGINTYTVTCNFRVRRRQ